MDKDTALKMAIEVFNQDVYSTNSIIHKTVKACQKALEQPTMTYEQGFAHGYEAHRVEQELEQPAQDFFERGKEIAKWADKQNEQPAQEPVAYMQASEINYIKAMKGEGIKEWRTCLGMNYEAGDVPLYTHPAPEWQGLSDDEIDYWECLKAPPVHPDFLEDDSWREFARCIEKALKEKNT